MRTLTEKLSTAEEILYFSARFILVFILVCLGSVPFIFTQRPEDEYWNGILVYGTIAFLGLVAISIANLFMLFFLRNGQLLSESDRLVRVIRFPLFGERRLEFPRSNLIEVRVARMTPLLMPISRVRKKFVLLSIASGGPRAPVGHMCALIAKTDVENVLTELQIDKVPRKVF